MPPLHHAKTIITRPQLLGLLVLLLLTGGMARAEKNVTIEARILYIERALTTAEITAMENGAPSPDPTLYVELPPVEGSKKYQYQAVNLTRLRFSAPITGLPQGQPLKIYDTPPPNGRLLATVTIPAQSHNILLILRGNADKDLQNARITVISSQDSDFPYGRLRLINASQSSVQLHFLGDQIQTYPAGDISVLHPPAGRRNSVPIEVTANSKGKPTSLFTGAFKLPDNQRVTLIVAGTPTAEGEELRTDFVQEINEPQPASTPATGRTSR